MISENSRLHTLQSIEFDSYKSFSEGGPFKIKADSSLTLIIGRNNCGKSSLIDIIEGFIRYNNDNKLPSGMQGIGATFTLSGYDIEYGFDRNTNSSLFGNYYKFGSQFIGKGIALSCTDKGMKPSNTQEEIFLSSSPKGSDKLSNWETIARKIENALRPICFRRVNADRDVVPETESDVETVGFNGDGATNIIRKFINNYFLDESIVEDTILNELNKIMQPDAHFSNIRIQQVKGEEDKEYKWEVFLEENEHRYALSKSGSGLKTILLILINLFLVPQTKECKGKEIVFAFEEIENNLHPALQRRIFQYLYDYAVENNAKVFITSHSHIAINTFYNKDHASIIHIMKDKGSSCLQIIESGRETAEILDDLDVKASDLFQSNGVIWVEGPSDRIYVLRWLQELAKCKLTEGLHFQFMYYGGRLLSHYELEDANEKTEGLINILTTNRNAAIIIDSDRKQKNARINATKRRVRDEFKNRGFFCWITQGKEIENYVAAEAVNQLFGCSLSQIGQYELFPDYIQKYDKNFSTHKVETARKLSNYITEDNSENILDLQDSILRLYNEILKWNNLGS